MAVAGGLLLGIGLRFHDHAPQQLATLLAFHQQAADELGGDDLRGAGEEALGEDWESVGGYGSGCGGWIEGYGACDNDSVQSKAESCIGHPF
jgi:hypothetical protein